MIAVLKRGTLSLQLQITALAAVFGVSFKIVYLDQSDSDIPNTIDIGSHHAFALPVHFLYRPGHYDLIYR